MRAGILSPCQPVADAGSVHSDAAELAYFRAWGPEVTSVENLVRVARMRWAIKETFEDAKGSVGLDQYEVRKWIAWYRRITFTLMAHASSK